MGRKASGPSGTAGLPKPKEFCGPVVYTDTALLFRKCDLCKEGLGYDGIRMQQIGPGEHRPRVEKGNTCTMALRGLRVVSILRTLVWEKGIRKGEYRSLWKMQVRRTIGHLSSQSEPRLIMKGLLIVGFLGIAESVIGPSLHFAVLYLIPIILVGWFGGRNPGVIMCAASVLARLSSHSIPRVFHVSFPMLYQHLVVSLGSYLVILFVLSVLKSSLEHEKEFARSDYLTGVGNRRSFVEDAHKEIDRARRYGHPFTFIYIDVDDLKVINDRFGHDVGDELLRSLAKAVRRELRMTDLIARLGGDEFCILLPETDTEMAELIVRRLQGVGESLTEKQGVPMPFSMGVVTFLDPPSSVEEMVCVSDKVMYVAKKNGKHTICREIFSKPGRISEMNNPAYVNKVPTPTQKIYQDLDLNGAVSHGAQHYPSSWGNQKREKER
jgi:diguanylate cyclase (GGDEF)-like protein